MIVLPCSPSTVENEGTMNTLTCKTTLLHTPQIGKLPLMLLACCVAIGLFTVHQANADDGGRGGWYQQRGEWQGQRGGDEGWRNNYEGGRDDGWRRNYEERRWDDDDRRGYYGYQYAPPAYQPPVIYAPQPMYRPPVQYYPQPAYPPAVNYYYPQ